MTENKLRELGIPRRGFLARAAVTAFATPVVASFTLDGTAEANYTSPFPNQTQCVGNQVEWPQGQSQLFQNQVLAGSGNPLYGAIDAVLQYYNLAVLKQGPKPRITPGLATQLAESLLQILLSWAADEDSVCSQIASFLNQLNTASGQLPMGLLADLVYFVQQASDQAGCVCT